MKPWKTVILCLLILQCSVVFSQSNADDIVRKYIAWSGGEMKWTTIRTIQSSGTYNYGGVAFPFTSYAKAPDKYRYVVPFEGKSFEQAFDGRKGWRIDGFKRETTKTILTEKSARAMANEAEVELLPPFIDSKKRGYAISEQKPDTVNGIPCLDVRVISKFGDTAIYAFSAVDYSLLKKTARSKNSEMKGDTVDIYYSDYRDVMGVKIPFQSVVKIKDDTVLKITVAKVEFNVNIPDAGFAP